MFEFSWKRLPDGQGYACEHVPYIPAPQAPELQCLNIYVPAGYVQGGAVDPAGSAGSFTAKTAPVIFENGIGGYMECAPRPLGPFGREYLARGFVYVTVGARGRGTKAADGTYIGKSPAALVDLKAAVRFLRANAARLPGDMGRIVSVGTSAGGAMSSLLGVTGNSENYEKELAAIGACEGRDDVFAAQCYCPIIDLENADMAYEWLFRADTDYTGVMGAGGTLSSFQQALSHGMAERYLAYFNRLGLRHPETGAALELAPGGRAGGAYDFLMDVLERAAEKYLRKLAAGELNVGYSFEDYMAGRYETTIPTPDGPLTLPGVDKQPFLRYDGERAAITTLDDYVIHNCSRMKACLAFDDLALGQAENEELGDERTNAVHFDPEAAAEIDCLRGDFPEAAAAADGYRMCLDNAALDRRKYLINPMSYIGTSEKSDFAPHFRIRLGTRDGHTSFTVAMALALKLMETGRTDVDYDMVWDEGHGPADYPGEFSDWVERICR